MKMNNDIRLETGKALFFFSVILAVSAAFFKKVTGFDSPVTTIQNIATYSAAVFGALYLINLSRRYLANRAA